MASDILIVDDEADIRELISGILEDEGHGTRVAKDSDETLAAIVLDVRDHDACAFGGEETHGALSDPARAARHHRHLAFEPSCHRISLRAAGPSADSRRSSGRRAPPVRGLRYAAAMPLYVLIGTDGPDSRERRTQARPGHLAHWQPLDAEGRVRFGGPLLDADGMPRGSVLVFEAPDLPWARTQAAADPYVRDGVFAHVEVHETRAVFPSA